MNDLSTLLDDYKCPCGVSLMDCKEDCMNDCDKCAAKDAEIERIRTEIGFIAFRLRTKRMQGDIDESITMLDKLAQPEIMEQMK